MQQWKAVLEQALGTIQEWKPLSGGDTSGVHKFSTAKGQFVAKTNSGSRQSGLLAAERDGLLALANTHTVSVPEVVLYEQNGSNGELLVSDFIAAGSKTPASLRTFGRGLAQLHQIDSARFGWTRDNFIGSLPQSNTQQDQWATFYVRERLQPQLQWAQDKGLLPASLIPTESCLHQVCTELLGNPKPSPLHGDLWGGNYLIDEQGEAYLIDPSFYCGHQEVDLAMSRLFGGFGPDFYRGYQEVIPASDGADERIDLYQLYYLLVHLNMFGRSYLSSVAGILQRYFG